MARPRNACVHAVYRLASEYQNTMASASGDSARHKWFNWLAAATNTTDHATIQAIACARVMRGSHSMANAVRPRRAQVSMPAAS